MAFGRNDGGFGSGLGGSFGTSSGYDPHRIYDGPYATRGVNREGSRVPREHEDEHPHDPPRGQHYEPVRTHFSEEQAFQQQGYGLSQYPQTGERERGPHYGKGPKGYKRTDDRIREEVCEVMSRQGFIDASDVDVTVEGGVVRLVGTVSSRGDKRGLELMADRVHGVEEVRNELRLKHLVTAKEAPSSQRDVPPQSKGSNGRTAHS